MPSSYSGPQPTPRIQVSRSGETPTTFDGSTPTTSTTFPPRRLSVMADTPIGNVMHEVDRRRRRRSSSVFDPTVQRPTLDRLAADALGGRSRSTMNGNTTKAKTTAAWSSVRLKVQKRMFSQALRSTPAIAASQFRLDVEKLWEDLSPERVVHDATIDLDEDIDEDAALAYKWDRHNSSNLFEALGQVTRDMVSLAVQSQVNLPRMMDSYRKVWHLLIIALNSEDRLARFAHMSTVLQAIPCVNETLLDTTLRESLFKTLIDMMQLDPHTEVRNKALFLLGEAAMYSYGPENDMILEKGFHAIAQEINTTFFTSTPAATSSEITDQKLLERKIYLIQALGRFQTHPSPFQLSIERLLTFVMYHELSTMSIMGALPAQSSGTFVVRIVLDTLVHQYHKTEQNQFTIGAIFNEFLAPFMKRKNSSCQTLAVRFVHQWMPVPHHYSHVEGWKVLLEGLQIANDMAEVTFPVDLFRSLKDNLMEKQQEAETLMKLHEQLLRELIAIPGTFTRLQPVKGMAV